MKTATSGFGIFAIATTLLTVCGGAAKGQSSQIYEFDSIDFNLTTNSSMVGSMSVPQFNPSLGKLDSVEVAFTSTYSSSVTISGPNGTSGTVEALLAVMFQAPGNNHPAFDSGWSGSFGPLPSFPNVSGNDVHDLDYTPISLFFGGFTGEGNVNFKVTANQSTGGVQGTTGVTIGIDDSTFDGSVEVTYNYLPVPEPGIFSLLVVGFGIMLTARKASGGGRHL